MIRSFQESIHASHLILLTIITSRPQLVPDSLSQKGYFSRFLLHKYSWGDISIQFLTWNISRNRHTWNWQHLYRLHRLGNTKFSDHISWSWKLVLKDQYHFDTYHGSWHRMNDMSTIIKIGLLHCTLNISETDWQVLKDRLYSTRDTYNRLSFGISWNNFDMSIDLNTAHKTMQGHLISLFLRQDNLCESFLCMTYTSLMTEIRPSQ